MDQSVWSEWTWNPQYNCYTRYRWNFEKRDWDYGYNDQLAPPAAYQDATSQPYSASTISESRASSNRRRESSRATIPCTAPGCTDTFNTIEDRDRHFKTLHSNNGNRPYTCPWEFDGCQANTKSWTTESRLRAHKNLWHGPYTCQEYGCSRRHPHGFGSQKNLDEHMETHRDAIDVYGASSSSQSYGPRPARSDHERSGDSGAFSPRTATPSYLAYGQGFSRMGTPSNKPALDKLSNNTIRSDEPGMGYNSNRSYRVYKSKDFTFGKIFKILWSEPTGSGGTQITEIREHGQSSFKKIRRFVVVNSKKGHSICLPILTYGGQGTLKRGAHPEDHAVIHSSREPRYLPGETQIVKRSIRCDMSSPSEKLDPASRLNYAKLYTIEHNVKVSFIGRVHRDFEQKVVVGYNESHPSLSDRTSGMGGAAGYAGVEDGYSNEYPTASGPSGYGNADSYANASSATTYGGYVVDEEPAPGLPAEEAADGSADHYLADSNSYDQMGSQYAADEAAIYPAEDAEQYGGSEPLPEDEPDPEPYYQSDSQSVTDAKEDTVPENSYYHHRGGGSQYSSSRYGGSSSYYGHSEPRDRHDYARAPSRHTRR